MVGAGVVAGLLPLSHAHSFALALAIGGCLALLFRRPRAWGWFFAVALFAAAPQLAWSARASAVRPASFLGWHLGWDRDGQNVAWFWLANTGLFIPLLITALIARRRLLPPLLLRFYLPFTLCFVVPNVVRLSPWIWDNIKFLFYWYVASAAVVALLLARMARGRLVARVTAPVLLAALVAAGGLDVWRMASGTIDHTVFDAEAMAFGRAVAEATPARAVVAGLPAHDSPVLLSGRPALLGYTGHIWSQGLDAGSREQDLQRFFAGLASSAELKSRYRMDYVLVGPRERSASFGAEPAWASLPVVVERGPYQLRRAGAVGRERPREEE
jgi:hypothetical protein